MTSKILAASLMFAAVAASAAAQSDKIHLLNGSTVANVRVTDWDIRSLRYQKGGNTESVQSDQVAKVELASFKTTYARGMRDPGLMLTLAKEQLGEKNMVLAQLGFVGASAQFFDEGQAAEAVSALDDLQKSIPEAGVLPEVFRQKFEYYMGLGGKGQSSAAATAKKYESEAIGGAWPDGFAVEAQFFQVLAENASPADFQNKLRNVIGKARTVNQVVANRANIELAHSLRKNKDAAGAARIYEEVLGKDGVDDSSRAGAYLGLGLIKMESAAEGSEEAKQALLLFLRVRLETRGSWPSLQAEALYHASEAAAKWRGPEYRYIMGRCRGVLLSEFKGSEWADQMRQRG
ncbi:MAG: hypothetical protein H6835_14225 [Planctomycetes bacterium]|nr:hypothetical protein [Planctomycetota bacterium]